MSYERWNNLTVSDIYLQDAFAIIKEIIYKCGGMKMQYGIDVAPYQRISKINKEIKKKVDGKQILKLILYFISSLLISRVMLVNSTAPFGIAALIAAVRYGNEVKSIVVGGGVLIGYISLLNSKVECVGAYLIIVATLVLMSYLLSKVNEVKKLVFFSIVIFLEFIGYKLFINKTILSMAFFTSVFEMICILPIYYIINRSIICFKEFGTKHLFSNEEVICMAVTISLIISGTWGFNIHTMSFTNIVALSFIICISYIKGSSVGAASGVAIGLVVGMCSKDMIVFISVYGICGLIAGTFKETGKVLTGLSYLVAFSIIKIYSNISGDFKIIEVILSTLVFYCIPNKIYDRLALEIDFDKKQQYMNENYGEKVKKMLVGRLDNFSEVLASISSTLQSLVDNDNLELKNRSAALVLNLADRVCENCNMNSICWKREQYYTYNAFAELIQNYQEKKSIVPQEIERKCIKRTNLLKCTEDIANKYIMSEIWRSRLTEVRKLLAEQILSMAGTVNEVVDDFSEDVKFNSEVENTIRRILNRKNINCGDILCFNDKKDRLVVKLSLEACGGTNLCVKEILPQVNSALGKNMCVGDEGCVIDSKTKSCSITLEETPKYHVGTHAITKCKDGEKNSGDSYVHYKLNDGTYITILSDGMGSGPQASRESNAAVKIIEKFTKAGFGRTAAINTVNSIMSLKFSADEQFSTLDLNTVDLYSGEVDFVKVGAVPSFIKSGSKVKVIKSNTLPMGVLDKVDIDTVNSSVKNGDMIITLSDGVLDYDSEAAGKEDWLVDFLEEINVNTPKELAEEIIKRAKELSKGKIKDDMTVVVSKIYSLY